MGSRGTYPPEVADILAVGVFSPSTNKRLSVNRQRLLRKRTRQYPPAAIECILSGDSPFWQFKWHPCLEPNQSRPFYGQHVSELRERFAAQPLRNEPANQVCRNVSYVGTWLWPKADEGLMDKTLFHSRCILQARTSVCRRTDNGTTVAPKKKNTAVIASRN